MQSEWMPTRTRLTSYFWCIVRRLGDSPFSISRGDPSSTNKEGTCLDTPPCRPVSRREKALLFAAFFVLACWLQSASNAYRAGLSGYPDEPAHFVTGLMVRDYLLHGVGTPPMRFAETYYLHMPKIGIGHWPPLFYLVEAVWMVVFPATRQSVLVLAALISAGLAFAIAREAGSRWGFGFALGSGLLFLSLPDVQQQTSMVMLDLAVSLITFAAALSFIPMLRAPNTKAAVKSGILTSLAILTKGNAWALAIVAPLCLQLSRQLRVLYVPATYLGATIVILMCTPWHLLTAGWITQGWLEGVGWSYPVMLVLKVVRMLVHVCGIPTLLLALPSVVRRVVIPAIRHVGVAPFWAVQAALIAGTVIFHSIIPTGAEPRKVMIAVPSIVLFATDSLFELLTALWPCLKRSNTGQVAAFFALLAFGAWRFEIPMKAITAFPALAKELTSHLDYQGAAILISSDAQGEGELIADIAMLQPEPKMFALRASKVLFNDNWNGTNYRLRFHSAEEISSWLDSIPVDAVVLHAGPPRDRAPHHHLLQLVLACGSSWNLWSRVAVVPAKPERGFLLLYVRNTTRTIKRHPENRLKASLPELSPQ